MSKPYFNFYSLPNKILKKHKIFVKKIFLILISLLFFTISIILGNKLAQAKNSLLAQNNNSQIAQEVYLKNCASCHTPIPAEVLPTETWQKILQTPQQHYGETLPSIDRISVRLMWNYLKTFSRPLLPGEAQPEYVTNSRYFKALHPQVNLPQPVTHKSCLICHPGARQLDYRSLNPEWQ
ncbi:putative low-redox potential cytochrome [Stanieria sp. NIES-3757]|nr:putative low-redox potential cytochrome [Stanieria sp. NIES-3757]